MIKCILLIMACVFAIQSNAQTSSIDYFGQVPPDSIPVKFAPGIISKDNRYELMTAFSNDGKEFWFTVTNKLWTHFDIWHTKYDSNKWSEPQIMPLDSGGFGPVFSKDDNRLFFSTGQWLQPPVGFIWSCKKTQTGWSKPEKLEAPINVGPDQWQCSIAKDGTFFFCSRRPGGKGDFDIYCSESEDNTYQNVTNLEILNSNEDEYSAFIAPDKSYIIFSSQRAGSYGWDDLYISFRKKDGAWSHPVNMGTGINTVNAEYSPYVTSDGKYLIYSVWEKNGLWGDIYWVRVDTLIKRFKTKLGLAEDGR